MSWSSSRIVELGLKKQPAPPPTWEKFPLLDRYYGGVRTVLNATRNRPEYPSQNSQSEDGTSDRPIHIVKQPIEKSETFHLNHANGAIQECFLDIEDTIKVPDLRSFNGVPSGMPDAALGSYDVLGLRDDICFDRFGRLGPYGFGYEKKDGGSGAGMEGDRERAELTWEEAPRVDYRTVNWNDAQKRCYEKNKGRFTASSDTIPVNELYHESTDSLSSTSPSHSNTTFQKRNTEVISRKALIIRTWSDYNYDDEDLIYLRSLMWELSLQTGGEYNVHFLVHVRDNGLPIWADEKVYHKVLNDSLPAEFHGLGTLWSETQMGMIYNKLPENTFRDFPLHGVFRSHFMAMTWFSYQHPEYEQIWQFEMDMRFTGHYLELLSKSTTWSASQPRKYLWERNSRFYVPSEHGSWEEFSHMVRVQTEHGTATKSNLYTGLSENPDVPDSIKAELSQKAERPIWGPELPPNVFHDNSSDIQPPHSFGQDKNEWGLGEAADLIVFNPLFDPHGTEWLLANDLTGYDTSSPVPRRAAVTTFGMYSRRLLMTMHQDLAIGGKHMFTEMFPATTALHHGFKAVYVPHPMLVERDWPTTYLASTFNGGRNGQSGGSRYSVFSNQREHNFHGMSWYYNSNFAERLWKRWLGYSIDGKGVPDAEVGNEGRMCLRSTLIHPVKQVDMVYKEETVGIELEDENP